MNEMSYRQHAPDNANSPSVTEPAPAVSSPRWHWSAWLKRVTIAAVALISATGGYLVWQNSKTSSAHPAATMLLPEVTVATPLADTVAPKTSFLGQFSAIDTVELRAQVGGTLLEIDFRDGQVVRKGDRLFVIDPRPFQVRFDQANAQLHMALGRKALADAELWRAQQLRQSSFGTAETVDQRAADQRAADATITGAKAAIRDAQLDLEFSQLTAPFDGRIGAHQASVGSLVSGSRAGSGPSTLLATVVSLDPIHIDFEMSEADYLAFQSSGYDLAGGVPVAISLSDGPASVRGTLDFIDNVVDRSSGTIRARATVPNPELSLTPGQFARVRLALGQAAPVLLVPAEAVTPDQSQQIVMVVDNDGKVTPKPVVVGDLHRGLRVVRSGINPRDRLIINGLVRVRPGAVVKPVPGAIVPTRADP